MNKERENLKGIMSQFVDTLIDTEVTEIRKELTKTQDTMNEEILELKRLVVNEIKAVKDTLSRELHTIQLNSNEKQISAQEVAEKESTIYKHMQSLATKMTQVLKEQESRQSSKFSTLEERVHKNEETLFITRDDHENLSLLLKKFATGLSILSSSDAKEEVKDTAAPHNKVVEFNTNCQPKQSPKSNPHQQQFPTQQIVTISN